MRNPVILLVLLAALGLVACEQKVDVAAEEEAVKAAVVKEMQAWEAADYNGLAAGWLHKPYIAHRSIEESRGWDSLSVAFKKTLESRLKEPDRYHFELTLTDIDIEIIGNCAFVVHGERYEGVWDGEPFTNEISGNIKHLVKVDGQWKVVLVF